MHYKINSHFNWLICGFIKRRLVCILKCIQRLYIFTGCINCRHLRYQMVVLITEKKWYREKYIELCIPSQKKMIRKITPHITAYITHLLRQKNSICFTAAEIQCLRGRERMIAINCSNVRLCLCVYVPESQTASSAKQISDNCFFPSMSPPPSFTHTHTDMLLRKLHFTFM